MDQDTEQSLAEAAAEERAREFHGEFAFLAAHYTEAASQLEGLTDLRLVLMRARALLRARRPAEAVSILIALETDSDRDDAVRRMLLGMAYTETDQGRLADAQLEMAAKGLSDGWRSELTYAIALRCWQRGDLDGAEALMLREVEREDAYGDGLASAHRFLSWVEAARGNLPGQVAHLHLAATALDRGTEIYTAAKVAQPMAVLAYELDIPGLALRAAEIAGGVRWSPDLAIEEWFVRRSLGWCDALDGDAVGALRRIKAAEAVAPSDAYRLRSYLDRIYLSRYVFDSAGGRESLDMALALAREIDWHNVRGEERLALLQLAEALAAVDPLEASAYVGTFRTLATSTNATLQQSKGDPRVDAFESYANGIIQRRLGERDVAEQLFASAYEIFDRFGYRWRAALCAVEIAEMRADATWFDRADSAISSYPRSWIAQRIRRSRSSSADPWLQELTPAQRSVLAGLLQGKKANAIARATGRSPNTVRVHMQVVYRVFGVSSQAELVVVAKRRGLDHA